MYGCACGHRQEAHRICAACNRESGNPYCECGRRKFTVTSQLCGECDPAAMMQLEVPFVPPQEPKEIAERAYLSDMRRNLEADAAGLVEVWIYRGRKLISRRRANEA